LQRTCLLAFAFALSETARHNFSLVKYSQLLAKSDKSFSSFAQSNLLVCLFVFWSEFLENVKSDSLNIQLRRDSRYIKRRTATVANSIVVVLSTIVYFKRRRLEHLLFFFYPLIGCFH
jgi:hypothetical protein